MLHFRIGMRSVWDLSSYRRLTGLDNKNKQNRSENLNFLRQ